MYCEKCNKSISATNWSHHLKTQKYQKKDPDGDIPLKKRGRPKTINDNQTIKPKTKHLKNNPDQTIKSKRRTNNVTCKELI